jgi:tetratricopeptide (TPR) repeat protein/TolB-like protein
LRAAGIVAATLVLGVGGWGLWQGATGKPDAADASAIAVLPFRVAGPGLDLWREGLVDLLSMNLDGASGLRTIPPRTVLSRWHRADGNDDTEQDRALQVVRSLGARYALSGSIVGGTGGLRLSAELIDVTLGTVEARTQIEGSADSVPALVDRLSVELLQTGGFSKGTGRVTLNLAGTTTRSLPALKHLLAGEQLFRHGRAGDALDEYRAALAADSAFALAAYRLALVDAWTHSPHYLSEIPAAVLTKMVGLVDRLPPREAAIARALPLLAEGDFAGLPLLRRVADDNPNDAEAWFQYGDALFHLGGPAGMPRHAFRDALRRSTQLDPGFAPAHIHLVEDAFDQLDSAEVLRILTVLRDIDPASPRTTGMGLAYSLVWGDSIARAAVKSAVDTAQTLALLTAKHAMGLTPDLAEETFVFGEALATQTRHAAMFRAQGNWGIGYAARGVGRLRRATEAMERGLRVFGIPEDGARIYLAHLEILDRLQGLADGQRADSQYRLLAGYPDSLSAAGPMGRYAASLRRWADVDRWIALAERNARQTAAAGDSASAPRHRLDARVLRAYLAEGRGQEGAVLAELQRSLDEYGAPADGEWSEAVPMLRMELGQRLLAKGEFHEALRQFDSFDIGAYIFTAAPGLVELYRGHAVEGLGDRAKARSHYARVVRWLRQADPVLVPVREEARAALARLTGEAGTQ